MVFRLRLFYTAKRELETVRKHSGHKIYSAGNFLKLMSDAKTKQNKVDMAYPKRFSQLQQWFTEKRAFANRLSYEIRNRAIFGRLRQFYSTEIKISYNASQRLCFASVISLNDLNDLRVIVARSLKCRQNIGRPGTCDSHTYHCLNLRSTFHVEFATEMTLSGKFVKENL